ncbi:unnamed protein product [Pleuronectes platessa]|uniref:Uncharacterized protein n=1 Tax=Pleuronectes platessa TaxID=8262 RepID=A0A9N7UGU8_PLEPL|nr:unnamed protein product [Pleuronectes platessa]
MGVIWVQLGLPGSSVHVFCTSSSQSFIICTSWGGFYFPPSIPEPGLSLVYDSQTICVSVSGEPEPALSSQPWAPVKAICELCPQLKVKTGGILAHRTRTAPFGARAGRKERDTHTGKVQELCCSSGSNPGSDFYGKKKQLTYSAGIKEAEEGLTRVRHVYVSYAIKMPWVEDDAGRSYSGAVAVKGSLGPSTNNRSGLRREKMHVGNTRDRSSESPPETRALPAPVKLHLQSIYPPSLVSMGLAQFDCVLGSRNFWQVAVCVAGPEAGRDGPGRCQSLKHQGKEEGKGGEHWEQATSSQLPLAELHPLHSIHLFLHPSLHVFLRSIERQENHHPTAIRHAPTQLSSATNDLPWLHGRKTTRTNQNKMNSPGSFTSGDLQRPGAPPLHNGPSTEELNQLRPLLAELLTLLSAGL